MYYYAYLISNACMIYKFCFLFFKFNKHTAISGFTLQMNHWLESIRTMFKLRLMTNISFRATNKNVLSFQCNNYVFVYFSICNAFFSTTICHSNKNNIKQIELNEQIYVMSSHQWHISLFYRILMAKLDENVCFLNSFVNIVSMCATHRNGIGRVRKIKHKKIMFSFLIVAFYFVGYLYRIYL